MLTFIQTFFPAEENETPEFHYDIFDLVASMQEKSLVACFRGGSKTTLLSKYLVLYASMFGHEDPVIKGYDVIIFLSDTVDQATDNVRELKDAYDLACDMRPEFGQMVSKGSRWLSDEVELINAAGYKLSFIARASGQKVRGIKRRGTRPNWLIVDDLENDEAVHNESNRRKLKQWFFSAVIPALHPTKRRVFFIGTPLHADSLLENLRADKTWNKIEIPIVDENGHPAWADRFPLWKIDQMKREAKEQGLLTSYFQEYMLQILADEDALFKPEYFRYKQSDELPDDLDFYITCDLAISQAKTADSTAMIVNGVDTANNWHIVNICIEKLKPHDQVKKLLNLIQWCYDKNKRVPTVGVEMVSYQKSFEDMFELELKLRTDMHHFVPRITELKADSKKERRIQQLEPMFRRKKVFFYKGRDIPKLEEELLMFPRAKHDDGCFTADTLICMKDGTHKQIVDIENDDEILTFNGYTNLHTNSKKAIMTGIKQVYRIELSDSNFIDATANHPILTQRGYVRVDELVKSDYIVRTSCKNYIKDISLQRSQVDITSQRETLKESVDGCTNGNTNKKSANNPKDITSITLMETRTTMSLATLSLYAPRLILKYIVMSQKALKEVKRQLSMRLQKLQSGTPQKKESSGIRNTTRKIKASCIKKLHSLVSIAEKKVQEVVVVKKTSSAQMAVCLPVEEQAELITRSVIASSVARNLPPTNILKSKRAPEGAEAFSLIKIESVNRLSIQPVYNLCVEPFNNFIVNGGYVVHNSDALAYQFQIVKERQGEVMNIVQEIPMLSPIAW